MKKDRWHYAWPVAMELYVAAVAAMVNYPLFEAKGAAAGLAWTALLLLAYAVAKRRWVYRVAATLLFVDGFVNLFHWTLLRAPVNAASLFVLMNTNLGEATEFMSLKLTPRLLLLLPYVFLYAMAMAKVPSAEGKTKGERWAWAVLATAALAFVGEGAAHGRFLRTAVPDTEKAIVSFLRESRAYRALKKRTMHPVEAALPQGDTASVYVLVLGESCNRSHMSLYGYGRHTTPRLERRDDIVAFGNVVTPYTNTMNSVLASLMERNMDNNISLDSSIHVFDVFHAAKFRTYWLSNQSPLGVWDNAVYNLARLADETCFLNATANTSMESTAKASYDELLAAPLAQALAQKAPHKFIVLHLMGCHSKYAKRYPPAYRHFRGAADKAGRIVDEYDNAVLYADFVADTLFSMLASYAAAHPDTRMAAVYVSDHGENVYDDGSDYAGHNCEGGTPASISEVPLLLWLPRGATTPAGLDVAALRARSNLPYMTDDLFHLLVDLADIATPCRARSRSLVSPQLDTTRVRRLDDGNVYARPQKH